MSLHQFRNNLTIVPGR